jgi:hypothetical protein
MRSHGGETDGCMIRNTTALTSSDIGNPSLVLKGSSSFVFGPSSDRYSKNAVVDFLAEYFDEGM